MRRLSSLVLTAMLAATTVGTAANVMPSSTKLLVGKTNIFCVQAPCPWRGIADADTQQPGPSGLLWAEQTLPVLDADPRDAERIRQAWDSDQCLLIDGELTGRVLRVDGIVGACP